MEEAGQESTKQAWHLGPIPAWASVLGLVVSVLAICGITISLRRHESEGDKFSHVKELVAEAKNIFEDKAEPSEAMRIQKGSTFCNQALDVAKSMGDASPRVGAYCAIATLLAPYNKSLTLDNATDIPGITNPFEAAKYVAERLIRDPRDKMKAYEYLIDEKVQTLGCSEARDWLAKGIAFAKGSTSDSVEADSLVKELVGSTKRDLDSCKGQ